MLGLVGPVVSERASVPCNGCTLCCRGDAIILHPECGDDVSLYETETISHPFTGKPVLMLTKKSNGDCTYLGATGCTIHDHAPTICREFDCGRMYERFTRAERRRMVASGLFDREVFEAGRRIQAERAKS